MQPPCGDGTCSFGGWHRGATSLQRGNAQNLWAYLPVLLPERFLAPSAAVCSLVLRSALLTDGRDYRKVLCQPQQTKNTRNRVFFMGELQVLSR